MADKSKIEWTDSTWNPIRARNIVTGKLGWHCEHVTEACRFCYAERQNDREGASGGTGFPYKPGHLGKDIEVFLDEKKLKMPMQWGVGRRIFPCSMTDLFADFVPDDWLDAIFAVMALAPQHIYQVLTKRPQRMARYFAGFEEDDVFHEGCRDALIEGTAQAMYVKRFPKEPDPSMWLAVHAPLPRVWLGTSVCDQADANEAIPHLLQSPAALHWISAEPLLGPIDLSPWISRLGWVVAGGESGFTDMALRSSHPDWFRSLRDQCAAARVPFLFKQWGAWHWDGQAWADGMYGIGAGDPLRVTRVPVARAGRLLDGIEHNGFPE